jgi:uncharacterized lipoprotein YddW (UPF0748 family)
MIRPGKLILLMVLTVLIASAVWYVWPVAESVRPPVRAIWVTRFDYKTKSDVEAILRNVAAYGFSDVFFQVRGNGTVYFVSELEPWAYELNGDKVEGLGRDPGWDPLATAIATAAPLNLRLHAYINVMPGWKGTVDPPPEAGQLWTAHPDWFMVDSLGQKMLPTPGWYSFVNPVLPEVRSHIRGIVSELCRYDVAGIHLDYIRYPHDYHLVAEHHYPDASDVELVRHADFSYDPASQAALFDEFGWDVSRDDIKQFRRESVSRVVRDISYVMQLEKPGQCILSASVLGNPVEGKHKAHQDSGLWAKQRLVDWVVQMNYNNRFFERYLKAMKKAAGRRAFRQSVVVGIYGKNSTDSIERQLQLIEESGCRGLAFFSYSFLFDKNHETTEKGRLLTDAFRPTD